MGDGSSVLSQNEVDALFKQATGKDIARAPTSRPAPSSTSRPPASPATPSSGSSPPRTPPVASSPSPLPISTISTPAPSSEVLETLLNTVANLSERMAKMETAISSLGQAEGGTTTDASVSIQQMSQKLEAMGSGLQGINKQIRGILIGLDGTPDYGIRQSFVCQSCGSHGFIAIPVRCTECGEEGWWGWWPQKEE